MNGTVPGVPELGFDPFSRPVAGHGGWGVGIHACVGMALARLEGECLLTALARQARSIELAGTPVRRCNNTLRGLSSLPLRVRAV